MDQMPTKRRRKSMDFEALIGAGQNLNGFTAQTANSTAKAGNCSGWNRQYKYPAYPEVPATGAWSNANRSGE